MSEESEYKNMMTCGHMSTDDSCPFECPDAKVLYRVGEEPEPDIPETPETE